MNIIIIGNGGREHTLAWKISQSPKCINLYIAPGNPGTALCGQNVDLKVDDIDGVKAFCISNDIDMVVIGPEAPLVAGMTDAFRTDELAHVGIIGPSAYAAQLEGSKAFAKKFMQKYNVPTAGYLEVSNENIDAGFAFLDKLDPPYVLKADGLAAGKGVLILSELGEAKTELKAMLDGKFGVASSKVVIEAFLDGTEFSVFALTDGKDYVLLPEAKDYKRIGEGDAGLNTGGMGAISPVPFVDAVMWEKVINNIVKPTIYGLNQEKMDYVGFVFFGLISVKGEPMVIEYNCRLGDPETEVVLPRIESDIVSLFDDVISGRIGQSKLDISTQSAATVMLVSGGYPGDYEKDKAITGAENISGSIVFQAGTAMSNDQLVTNGGRVIALTSLAPDFRDAIKMSIQNAKSIDFEGKYYRTDIGFDL